MPGLSGGPLQRSRADDVLLELGDEALHVRTINHRDRPMHTPLTGRWRCATLDRLPQRLHANKAELQRALDHRKIPPHSDGSANDIRCQVTKRRISGVPAATSAAALRWACQDLRKLGVGFRDYMGDRLNVFGGPTSRLGSAVAQPQPDTASTRGFAPATRR